MGTRRIGFELQRWLYGYRLMWTDGITVDDHW